MYDTFDFVDNSITKKQLKYISDIEKYVKQKFSGTTKKEASDFIQANLKKFNENKKKYYSSNPYAIDDFEIIDCYDLGISPWGEL